MVFGKRCQRDTMAMGSAGSTRSLANNNTGIRTSQQNSKQMGQSQLQRPSQRQRGPKPSTMSLPLQLEDVVSEQTQSDARNTKLMNKVISSTRSAYRQSPCIPDDKVADREVTKPSSASGQSSCQHEQTQTTSPPASDSDTVSRIRRPQRHTEVSQQPVDTKTKAQKRIFELESANLALVEQIQTLEESVEYLQSDIQCSAPLSDYKAALKIKDKFIQKLGSETHEIREEVTKLKIKYKRKIRSMNCQLTEARQTNCIKILELKTALEQLKEENEQLSDELYQLKESRPYSCECHLKSSSNRLDDRRTSVIVELSAKVSEQNAEIISLQNSLTEKDRVVRQLESRASSANPAKNRPSSERRKEAVVIGGSIQRTSQSEPVIGEINRPQSTDRRGNSDSRCGSAVTNRPPAGEQDLPETKALQTMKSRQKKSADDRKSIDRKSTVVTVSEDTRDTKRKATRHVSKCETVDESAGNKLGHIISGAMKRPRNLAGSGHHTRHANDETRLESSISDDNSWDSFTLTQHQRAEQFLRDLPDDDSDDNKDVDGDDAVRDGSDTGDYFVSRPPHHAHRSDRTVRNTDPRCREYISKHHKGVSVNESSRPPILKMTNAQKLNYETVLEEAEELIQSLADKTHTVSTMTAAATVY